MSTSRSTTKTGSPSNALYLRSVSSVLLAQQHNPSIINPEFLRANRIAGEDWKVEKTVSSSPLAKTIYKNGISCLVELSRCVVTQEIKGSFRDRYEAFDAARQYALALKHTPYSAVGLNWHLHFPITGSKAWLSTRFLRPDAWPATHADLHTLQLQFKFRIKDGFCTYAIAEERTGSNGGRQEVISVNCNFHFDLSADPRERIQQIEKTIENGTVWQGLVLENLDLLVSK